MNFILISEQQKSIPWYPPDDEYVNKHFLSKLYYNIELQYRYTPNIYKFYIELVRR